MKVLVVHVLAFFTGCNANLLYADEPTSKLDELITAFQDSAGAVITPAEDFLDRLQQTKFGKDLSVRLEEVSNLIGTNVQHIDEALGHPLRGVGEHFSLMLYGLALSIEEKKEAIHERLEPLAESLAPVAEKVLSGLTQKVQGITDIASPYVKSVMEKVDSWSQDLLARLDILHG